MAAFCQLLPEIDAFSYLLSLDPATVRPLPGTTIGVFQITV